jgi:hypothetical protein
VWYIQGTVSVSAAGRFSISVNPNYFDSNQNQFIERVSYVGRRTKRLNDGPITAFGI